MFVMQIYLININHMKKLNKKNSPTPKVLKEENIHTTTIKLSDGCLMMIPSNKREVLNRSVGRHLSPRA